MDKLPVGMKKPHNQDLCSMCKKLGRKCSGLVEEDVSELQENQSCFIPEKTRHRLQNQKKIDLEIIEVQAGSYLEEDDIVRFDDDYGR